METLSIELRIIPSSNLFILFKLMSVSVGLAHSTFHREARTSPHLYLHRDPELVRY